MSNLQGKVILIVGGSSGLGFGVALAALQSQASVVIIASSNPERVANAVRRLKLHELSGEVRGEVVDARNMESVKELAERINTVDHVVWSSGDITYGFSGTGSETGSQEARSGVFAVRFWAPFVLAQHLKIRPEGSITLTSGTSDVKVLPQMVTVTAVCAALEGLTKGLAVDLAPIRVNLVGPGIIDTEIWDKQNEHARTKLQDLPNRVLLNRIGQANEVAEAYIFLMKCGYITGQRINVDGGIALK